MIDQALMNAGIQDTDIETRLEGQGGKALFITRRELMYFENDVLQRAKLREIVNVKTTKSGELSVKSPSESLIEGTIKGFDLAELKFFFESVKNAIARAKASVTGTDFPAPKAPEPAAPAPMSTPVLPTPEPNWNASPSSSAWMPEKQTFEVPPETPEPRKPSKDSWADLEAELNPTKSGSVPPLLNASAMIPPPSPSAAAKPALDPFADLAKNSPSASSDDWDSPSATLNLQPNTDATAVVVPSSGIGEWDGEVMDATKALDNKTPKKGKNNVRIGDNSAALEGIARALRLLAIVFFLVSAAVPAVLYPQANELNVVTLVLMLVAVFGSLLLMLIALGLAELLSAWAKASRDLRSIRKATLGH
ncbi:MAG: hypothetical protein ACK41E_02900 [Deinococcales bacterium]